MKPSHNLPTFQHGNATYRNLVYQSPTQCKIKTITKKNSVKFNHLRNNTVIKHIHNNPQQHFYVSPLWKSGVNWFLIQHWVFINTCFIISIQVDLFMTCFLQVQLEYVQHLLTFQFFLIFFDLYIIHKTYKQIYLLFCWKYYLRL